MAKLITDPFSDRDDAKSYPSGQAGDPGLILGGDKPLGIRMVA